MSIFTKEQNQSNMILLTIEETFRGKVDYLLGFLVVFFMPYLMVFWVVGGLVFLDLFTGVLSSYKKGIKIESNRLKNTVVKLLLYLSFVLACILGETAVPEIPFMKVAMGIITTVEVLSVGENTGFNLKKWFKEQFSKYRIPDDDEKKD